MNKKRAVRVILSLYGTNVYLYRSTDYDRIISEAQDVLLSITELDLLKQLDKLNDKLLSPFIDEKIDDIISKDSCDLEDVTVMLGVMGLSEMIVQNQLSESFNMLSDQEIETYYSYIMNCNLFHHTNVDKLHDSMIELYNRQIEYFNKYIKEKLPL